MRSYGFRCYAECDVVLPGAVEENVGGGPRRHRRENSAYFGRIADNNARTTRVLEHTQMSRRRTTCSVLGADIVYGVLHIVVVIVCARPGGDDNGEGPRFRRDLQNQYWHLARLRSSPRARVRIQGATQPNTVFRRSNPVRFGQTRTTIPGSRVRAGFPPPNKTARPLPPTTDNVRAEMGDGFRTGKRLLWGHTPCVYGPPLCGRACVPLTLLCVRSRITRYRGSRPAIIRSLFGESRARPRDI